MIAWWTARSIVAGLLLLIAATEILADGSSLGNPRQDERDSRMIPNGVPG